MEKEKSFSKNGKFKKGTDFGEDSSEKRMKQCLANDRIDEKFGFERFADYKERIGFMINMHVSEILDENKRLISAVDYYFLEEDGGRFKATVPFQPYFYVLVNNEALRDLSSFLKKKYDGVISNINVVTKEDLDLPNHLVGLKQRYLKLSFPSMTELMKVRREVLSAVRKNKAKTKSTSFYTEMMSNAFNAHGREGGARKYSDQFDNILDIREYDVPYHVRVSIDLKLFAGVWYAVQGRGQEPPVLTRRHDLIDTPDLIVLAYDIECTKQPLKFPDAAVDQIMMISYMVDNQGYLVNNREVISADVQDFEYTPHPEFEGNFIVVNEPDEKSVLERFFEHICDVKPHVIVTYNGDNFDWPFVEQRAAFHGLDMALDIGFSGEKDGIYACRPVIHMDCLWWVKRDSYLPVGSQNLKAVAKAKLRYDPVEIDPEDMCAMAAEEPQTMCNYSVSDAVATYYLYMKYVHPFIFALCTILPMEPDEVLRKGSGTLCEALLMVEAFHVNIVFPNKQEQELNKATADGNVLDSETYVGGHVEALESGVFRADLPCRFKLVPEAFDKLIDGARHALVHAIVEEEKVPLDKVENLDSVVKEVQKQLAVLRDQPIRVEPPVILHLDVGAMYPNIILTNRLQPSAIVTEETCAACDFNRPGATCQRPMNWVWRGECMPASRSEFARIQQQLETEKFPPLIPGGPPRAFHQLPREEAAAVEKKRLAEYCRRAYKKTHVTKTEVRTTTICQKENSFYVDTVRAFRDRRYEYKEMCKNAKRAVVAAVAGGDARDIKSAKNREVLYDSLQLAHKCILNSFYGYVMRRGARWHSMEMAGIVCHTGAAIITKAREIVEQVGRPLELDTDGIWCILPSSFPQDFTVLTTHEKKKKLNISYPNAVLNCMVKEEFTNDQYQDLIDANNLKYEQRSENSIFFEVDGPYLAMVLPAAKEEGKKLKKRYAVFNFDKSLAELKGFEVKRRGELQLIKIFQSSVFESFLKGETLEKCYEAVAKVADYWLDVLYSKASNLPDSELFDLISEKKSMSRKLEDYGAQKSTSISTAKRLAEFLGDQMVKDKGLACRFIISRRPEGAPVTERAIPLAIFQSEPSVKRHFLRKWLKDSSLTDIDIRQVLDWSYYIERLNGTIQKIITIPAALQGLSNPVPRVRHPDWLHKKMLEKDDVLKQRKVNEFFQKVAAPLPGVSYSQPPDVEDAPGAMKVSNQRPLVNRKRKRGESLFSEEQLSLSWREAFGTPPPFGTTQADHIVWLQYHKKKWSLQLEQRRLRRGEGPRKKGPASHVSGPVMRNTGTIAGFIKKAQRTILDCPWQVVQYAETSEPGLFRVWALVEKELHVLKLSVPRIFYVNQRTPRPDPTGEVTWKRANRQLPRSRPALYLYEYTVPEPVFQQHSQDLLTDLSTPDVEGIYETQVPPDFRVLVTLGCCCAVDRAVANKLSREGMKDTDTFTMQQLIFKPIASQPYLNKLPDGTSPLKHIFLYQHHSANTQRSIYGVFLAPTNKAAVFVLDSVRTNQMPQLHQLFLSEREVMLQENESGISVPGTELEFEINVLTDAKQLYKAVQRVLQKYRDEKRGPTMIILQTAVETTSMVANMPELTNFPVVTLNRPDPVGLYGTLEWQRVGARTMIQHYLRLNTTMAELTDHCRYFHIPIGNMPADPALFGADLFFSRHLLKNNLALWCSPSPLPDLGGRQADDGRLLSEIDDVGTSVVNVPGAYSTVCLELDVDALAVNTLLQSHHVHDVEGTSSNVAFDSAPSVSVDDMVGGTGPGFASCDDTALSSPAFRVLRATVSSWLRDVSMHRNIFADQQIVHFYRWLRSPNALLYEPALRRTLHTLMKKLFIQLIAEFRRLGSVVVHANFSKILLCSRKLTVTDAVGYVDFILASVNNKELFHSIHISVSQCWEHLLWLDPANYGGVQGKLSTNEEGISDTDNTTDDACPIVMNWSLAERLPIEAEVRESFSAIVAGYIGAIWGRLKEQGRTQMANASPQRRATPGAFSQVQSNPQGVGVDDSLKEFTIELVSGTLSEKLFTLVQKMHRILPTVKSTALGMEGKTITPALEFTKAVSRVLELDSAVEEPVARMRRNMLKLIGIGEFSSAAAWTEPCVPAVLPEVICTVCNHCRDLDLCKDPYRVEENGRPAWACPICEACYDPADIEYQLLDTVQRKTISYTLQDLQCTKCHQIQADNLTEYCTCAGNFETVIPAESLRAYLKTLESVADHFQLPLLLETVKWMQSVSNFSQVAAK